MLMRHFQIKSALKWLWRLLSVCVSEKSFPRRRRAGYDATTDFRGLRKPDWIRSEIIRLKALMPESGCRAIAHAFNRRFATPRRLTVGKTFVADVIRKHHYDIQVLRRNLKHAKPKHVPRNLIWGLDLTGKTDAQGERHMVLGILDHGSRALLCLEGLQTKCTFAIMTCLMAAVRRYGKPKCVRTDNEAVFVSRLFRYGLMILGIRHQRSDPGCPWQNGRIERFFGTLKEKLDQWEVDSLEMLNRALGEFRFWYNHVRPHQHLDGKTPSEAWRKADVFGKRPKEEYWFEAWDGLLAGYYRQS